jgi:hypothetical protein
LRFLNWHSILCVFLLPGKRNRLRIKVTDTGVGLNKTAIETILKGNASSTDGAAGRQGL